MKAMFERAQIHGMAQIDREVFYDGNDDWSNENEDEDEDNGDTFHDTIQAEVLIDASMGS